MAVENSDKFDLNAVEKSFNLAILEEDDVHLEHYLKSYEELNK